MDATTFGLRPEQEAYIKNCYPTWPYVKLGSSNDSGTTVQVLPHSPPLNNSYLKSCVDLGRVHFQTLSEGDIDDVYRRATSPPHRRGDDPSGRKHQRTIDLFTGPDGPDSLWSSEDRSRSIDNRGSVTYEPICNFSSNNDGDFVDRRFDYVLSVLESLWVGMPDELAWELNGSVK